MKIFCDNCRKMLDMEVVFKEPSKFTAKCPICGIENDVNISFDKCIIMAFADDSNKSFFTDNYTGENIRSIYAFDTISGFLHKWKKLVECPDSMWYYVLDKGDLICSGACDPYDIEIFKDHFNIENADDLLMLHRDFVYAFKSAHGTAYAINYAAKRCDINNFLKNFLIIDNAEQLKPSNNGIHSEVWFEIELEVFEMFKSEAFKTAFKRMGVELVFEYPYHIDSPATE